MLVDLIANKAIIHGKRFTMNAKLQKFCCIQQLCIVHNNLLYTLPPNQMKLNIVYVALLSTKTKLFIACSYLWILWLHFVCGKRTSQVTKIPLLGKSIQIGNNNCFGWSYFGESQTIHQTIHIATYQTFLLCSSQLAVGQKASQGILVDYKNLNFMNKWIALINNPLADLFIHQTFPLYGIVILYSTQVASYSYQASQATYIAQSLKYFAIVLSFDQPTHRDRTLI